MSDLSARIWIPLLAQLSAGLGGLAALALAPPPHGSMLLLPLRDGTPTARLARQGDALLVASGPYGSLVVQGDRQALFWPLLRAGILTIAAPSRYCGGKP